MSTLKSISLVIGEVIVILWIRVCLETVIVIFNIAKSLESIDERIQARSS